MSQSYVKECVFCQEKIRMSDRIDGKWLPFDLEGNSHNCQKNGEKKEQEPSTVKDQARLNRIIKQMSELLKQLEDLKIKEQVVAK